jgi:hypothetical protein
MRAPVDDLAVAEPKARRGLLGTGFLAGLTTNLLNPKVGVFFVTFLPGFVPHGYPVGPTSLLFGAVFLGLSIAYYVGLVALATKLTDWIAVPRIRRPDGRGDGHRVGGVRRAARRRILTSVRPGAGATGDTCVTMASRTPLTLRWTAGEGVAVESGEVCDVERPH